MRSVSVAAIFVVGYALSAVAQNSTPKPGKPPTQVAPNLDPPWPVRPATQMQTLKSLPPTGTLTLRDLNAKPELECPYRTEELCDQAGCRNVIVRPICPD
jgi:hypothetical protein